MPHILTPDGRLLSLSGVASLTVDPLCRDYSITEEDNSPSVYFYDVFDEYAIAWSWTEETDMRYLEQDHITVLGWYIRLGGEVVCSVENRADGVELIKNVANRIVAGHYVIKVKDAGDSE